MSVRVSVDDHEVEARVVRVNDDELVVEVEGTRLDRVVRYRSDSSWVLEGEGRVERLVVARGDQGVVWIHDGRRAWRCEVTAGGTARGAGGANADPGRVIAPLPGRVVALHVAEGDEVSEDDPVAVVEAMKMEQTLTAPAAGIVVEVLVETGTQVGGGDVLLRLEVRS